jgi:ABC-type phosphate transport system substrate-binding protein
MKRAIFFVPLLAVLLAGPAPAADHEFLVVANPSVAVEHLSAAELERIFQKRQTRWGDGSAIVPLEQSGAVRAHFYRDVMHLSVSQISGFWIQEAMTEGVRPPKLLQSATQVVRVVSDTPGAIGFVSVDADISGGEVKRIRLE